MLYLTQVKQVKGHPVEVQAVFNQDRFVWLEDIGSSAPAATRIHMSTSLYCDVKESIQEIKLAMGDV